MSQSLLALALQEEAASDPTLIIVIAVVVLLFFLVVIIAIGLAVFFFMRKRNKERAAAALSGEAVASMPAAEYAEMAYAPSPVAADDAVAFETPTPTGEAPSEEIRADVFETPAAPADSGELDFDPSRTVAINRESTVAISYGTIRFVSGVLAGQEFNVNPEGSYIGREASLSQIVVPDPRISKRHLWIGVKDGLVRIVDQESRNGTFVNDPKSERITEATLTTGDTVILGESDVARFEYQM
jgi:hypothetical protein